MRGSENHLLEHVDIHCETFQQFAPLTAYNLAVTATLKVGLHSDTKPAAPNTFFCTASIIMEFTMPQSKEYIESFKGGFRQMSSMLRCAWMLNADVLMAFYLQYCIMYDMHW